MMTKIQRWVSYGNRAWTSHHSPYLAWCCNKFGHNEADHSPSCIAAGEMGS